jgi:signal transduction histidine kinase/ligand-binding sensor domain-containing protein
MSLRVWLCIFLQTLIFIQTSGQKPVLGFIQISVEDGLSENTVRAIIEDADGYMWFGSEDGLNRYDGYSFTAFHSDKNENTTLTSRSTKGLFKDSKKNLWVLTADGVNIYDSEHEVFYNYRNDHYAALQNIRGDIANITEDAKGDIWIATVNEGLFQITALDKPAKNYPAPHSDESKYFLSVLTENDSLIWVGTNDGLLSLNPITGKYRDHRALFGYGYGIRNMHKDKQNRLWLCSNNGLKIIHPNQTFKNYTPENSALSGNNVINLVPYGDDAFLLAIDGGGLDIFYPETETVLHYDKGLSSRNVISLFKDSKEDLWVGTYLNGISYSNTTTNLFFLNHNNSKSNEEIQEGIVTSFFCDSKGDFWVTTDGGGLYRKPVGKKQYIRYQKGDKGLKNNALINIIEDTKGRIWITSYGGGLIQYDRTKDLFYHYEPNSNQSNVIFTAYTKAIKQVGPYLWISGYGYGIDRFDPATRTFTHYQKEKDNLNALPSDWVQSFFVDKDSTLWLCTFGGLAQYLPATNSFKTFLFSGNERYTQADMNTIMDIIEDEEGNLWIGTIGAGLICLNKKTKAYTFYTTKDGLSNNCIRSLILDDYNNLWVATNSGLSMFNVKTRQARAFTTKDGLPTCSFYQNSRYKDKKGRISLGSNNGYLMIDPLLYKINTKVPPIVITNFRLFNKSIHQDSANSPLKLAIGKTKIIYLDHTQNSITFEFSALNFNSSGNNQFAYYLEGFEEKWGNAGNQRVATYTNLFPGTYVFRVKGCNNDGVWNEEGAFITIVINPPFWLTWWFYTLASISLILSLFLIYKWRVRRIKNKNAQLERTVSERTHELQIANEQLETFVYRASHDIKGPLKSIIGLTTIGKKDIQDTNAQLYFDHILSSTLKLDSLLTDLIQSIRIRNSPVQYNLISFAKLIEEIKTSFEQFPGYEEMQFKLEINDSGSFYSDYKLLYSIIQNLFENAIKYRDQRKEQHTLDIQVNVNQSGASLVFKDNGMGIAEENQNNIFEMFYKANEQASGSGLGLYIVKNSVLQLGGTILLESNPGVGTVFTLNFPSKES